tara:strand:+ start:1309 stop:2511 length:1203 start_codon:yes stop_codon:yes gene_type:complete
MAIKDNIDFSTFSDPSTASDLYSNSIRRAFSYDSYGDKRRFQAIVLTNPIPVSPDDLKFFNGTSKKISSKISKYVYRARIIGDNSPHSFLPDPCSTTFAADQNQALKIIEMHTLFISNIEFGSAESLPKINTIVEVELEKNTFGYNLQIGKHVKVSSQPQESNTKTSVDCDSLKNIVANASGVTSLGGTSGPGGKVVELANSLPVIEEGEGTIVGSDLNTLTAIVEAELALWDGKQEQNADMYETLKKYWDNLGETGWTPAGVPWSAAFISWVVGQADSSFPKSQGHYFYAASSKEGKGGWSAWSVSSGKIRAQVGDILVRARTGAGAGPTSAHGDVVYKISGNEAILAGGNIGGSNSPGTQTAKVAKKLTIDSDGNYSGYSSYIMILKKNGKVEKIKSA